MILRRITFLIFSVALFNVGCKNNAVIEELDIDYGYDYLPLEIGKWIEYSVDSFIYDTTGMGVVIDTSFTLVREEVTDTFTNLTNDMVYRVERFERENELQDWTRKAVYSSYKTTDRGFRTEDNLRFIKMVFPLENGEIWDGNLFIDKETIVTIAGESVEVYKDWSYEIDGIDEPDAVNNMAFDSVMTIYQANNQFGQDINNIELRYSFEKYAKGLGLIYREMKILDTQCIADCIGQTWEEKAQKGFILKQRITGHN